MSMKLLNKYKNPYDLKINLNRNPLAGTVVM